jgi:hypothetical protein
VVQGRPSGCRSLQEHPLCSLGVSTTFRVHSGAGPRQACALRVTACLSQCSRPGEEAGWQPVRGPCRLCSSHSSMEAHWASESQVFITDWPHVCVAFELMGQVLWPGGIFPFSWDVLVRFWCEVTPAWWTGESCELRASRLPGRRSAT